MLEPALALVQRNQGNLSRIFDVFDLRSAVKPRPLRAPLLQHDRQASTSSTPTTGSQAASRANRGSRGGSKRPRDRLDQAVLNRTSAFPCGKYPVFPSLWQGADPCH
jgi:hypothetical protein